MDDHDSLTQEKIERLTQQMQEAPPDFEQAGLDDELRKRAQEAQKKFGKSWPVALGYDHDSASKRQPPHDMVTNGGSTMDLDAFLDHVPEDWVEDAKSDRVPSPQELLTLADKLAGRTDTKRVPVLREAFVKTLISLALKLDAVVRQMDHHRQRADKAEDKADQMRLDLEQIRAQAQSGVDFPEKLVADLNKVGKGVEENQRKLVAESQRNYGVSRARSYRNDARAQFEVEVDVPFSSLSGGDVRRSRQTKKIMQEVEQVLDELRHSF